MGLAFIGFCAIFGGIRARSSAGEHYVDIVGVAGSIPAVPTTLPFSLLILFRIGGFQHHQSLFKRYKELFALGFKPALMLLVIGHDFGDFRPESG